MPNYGAKVSSAYLSSDVMREFIAALPTVMRDLYGNQNLTVYYGWDCNLQPDLLYEPISVALDVFPHFIEYSIEQGIFEVGGSDLLIESPDSSIEITICHESDIHIDGTDDDALRKIVARFPQLDFRTADEWKAEDHNESETDPPASAE